jgi:hypothetical protein
VNTEGSQRWFTVRVLVEIEVGDEADPNDPSHFEDRFILVRAEEEADALLKGKAFAEESNEEYLNEEGQTVRWILRRVIDAHRILDVALRDGTELYSAFVNRDLAEVLTRGGDSPLKAWLRQHPGADPGTATAREVIEAWEQDSSE